MNLFLNSYALSCKEQKFRLFTLSGGDLSKRHWQASCQAESAAVRWGHRVIAIIEAVPIIGMLASAIEILANKYFNHIEPPKPSNSPDSDNSSESIDPLNLEFNRTYTLRTRDVRKIEILPNWEGISGLPEYSDSIFQIKPIRDMNSFEVTRRRKGIFPPILNKNLTLDPLVGPKKKYEYLNEASKVRSFSLELRSNIEDLRDKKEEEFNIAAPSKDQKRELQLYDDCSNAVRFFIENRTFDKKAGFEDYCKFLELLHKEVKEIRSVLKRHFELLALQSKLPKRKAVKKDSWERVRTLIRSGLLTKKTYETAKEARALGLSPFPKLPRSQKLFNLYPTIDSINLLDKKNKKAGRWVHTRKGIITFKELCTSIKKSCSQISDEIKSWDDYYVLTITGKSQAWMADIGYRYLAEDKLPKGVVPLSDGLYEAIQKLDSLNFIMFDDGAYSCTQLYDYIHILSCKLLWNKVPNKKINLYFIYGTFPEGKDWRNDIDVEFLKKHNVNVKILSNHLTKRTKDLINKEGLSDSFAAKITTLAPGRKILVTTEWKTPDFVSLALFARDGYLLPHCREQYDLSTKGPDIVLDGFGPITEVKSPYK